MTGWNKVTPPTCLVPGTQERHCTRCPHKESQSVGLIPHNWMDDYETKWVAYHECKKCGFQTENDDTIVLHALECGGTYTTKEKQKNILIGHHCTECGTKERY